MKQSELSAAEAELQKLDAESAALRDAGDLAHQISTARRAQQGAEAQSETFTKEFQRVKCELAGLTASPRKLEACRESLRVHPARLLCAVEGTSTSTYARVRQFHDAIQATSWQLENLESRIATKAAECDKLARLVADANASMRAADLKLVALRAKRATLNALGDSEKLRASARAARSVPQQQSAAPALEAADTSAIRLRSNYASPSRGAFSVGDIVELPKSEAENLVRAGYATSDLSEPIIEAGCTVPAAA